MASLLLLLAEHRRGPRSRRRPLVRGDDAAGAVAILLALSVLGAHAGGGSFAALRRRRRRCPRGRAAGVRPRPARVRVEGGRVPLHVWLPRAHPEAPSTVSALMSAAMVNLGIYGIVRVGFDLLGGRARVVVAAGARAGSPSALFGDPARRGGTDLKRLLAYSTTDNMGLVLIGVGAAGALAASGHLDAGRARHGRGAVPAGQPLGVQELLFLAAGSVQHATGRRDLDRLGGLLAGVPATTAAFGVGALSRLRCRRSAAFASEWLLLQALPRGFRRTARRRRSPCRWPSPPWR